MNTIIYYMTGTGNSLAVAKKIAEQIEDCELIPITKLPKDGVIVPDATRVGYVYPAYFLGVPLPVRRLLERTEYEKAEYIFAVATSGGTPGKALIHVQEILEEKKYSLSSGYHCYMPDNYLPMFDAPKNEKLNTLLREAMDKAILIAEDLHMGKKRGVERSRLGVDRWISPFMYPTVYKFHTMDQEYWTTGTCNGCGLCARLCPFENIEIHEGRPSWSHHCEMCMRCIHLCPQKSIQYKKKTLDRWRYVHPQISVEELNRDSE